MVLPTCVRRMHKQLRPVMRAKHHASVGTGHVKALRAIGNCLCILRTQVGSTTQEGTTAQHLLSSVDPYQLMRDASHASQNKICLQCHKQKVKLSHLTYNLIYNLNKDIKLLRDPSLGCTHHVAKTSFNRNRVKRRRRWSIGTQQEVVRPAILHFQE